jgi:hypothetical protein
MMTYEIARLYHQLSAVSKTLTESISFETLENDWSFVLDFERTGNAVIKGKVASYPPEDNSLQYEFRIDPISLEAFTRDLNKIVTAFPIKD